MYAESKNQCWQADNGVFTIKFAYLHNVRQIEEKNQNFRNLYTPGSNFTYFAPQDNFSLVPNCSLGTPKCKYFVLKINLFGLCENAWLTWQPVMQLSRNELYLQNQGYCSCYLSWTTKIGTKLNIRHVPYSHGRRCNLCNLHVHEY